MEPDQIARRRRWRDRYCIQRLRTPVGHAQSVQGSQSRHASGFAQQDSERAARALSSTAECVPRPARLFPLYPALPPAVVPHVFPLVVDEPEQVCEVLKRQGVPIIRFGEFLWPSMPRTRCPVSMDLSRRVLQFPCHQELAPDELEWMIERIRQALLALRHPTPRRQRSASISSDGHDR